MAIAIMIFFSTMIAITMTLVAMIIINIVVRIGEATNKNRIIDSITDARIADPR